VAAAATPQGERRKRIRLRPYVSGPNAGRRVGVKQVTVHGFTSGGSSVRGSQWLSTACRPGFRSE
jgi:hypothetical protein